MLQLCNQKLKWEIEYNLYIRDANKDGMKNYMRLEVVPLQFGMVIQEV
jgi:hypothetical protein